MFKLEKNGCYQGYAYTLTTQKASLRPGYGFISRIEIEGVQQEATLATKANAYEAHQEGLRYLKQLVETYPVVKTGNQLAS